MKREELKAKGLTEEQIDFVMGENGKDIEKFKTTAETAKTEADTIKSQLVEANKAIEGFKGMNIDQIKASADEWKTKAEQAAADAQKAIAGMKFDHALDQSLAGAKAKNAKAVKALLDMSGLKLKDDGSIDGLDDQLKKVKEANDYLFESDVKNPRLVAGGNSNSVLSDAFTSAARKAAGLPDAK